MAYRGYRSVMDSASDTRENCKTEVEIAKEAEDLVNKPDTPPINGTSPQDIDQKEGKMSRKNTRRGRPLSQESIPTVGNDESDDVTDLVLIIHGIGQGVSPEPYRTRDYMFI